MFFFSSFNLFCNTKYSRWISFWFWVFVVCFLVHKLFSNAVRKFDDAFLYWKYQLDHSIRCWPWTSIIKRIIFLFLNDLDYEHIGPSTKVKTNNERKMKMKKKMYAYEPLFCSICNIFPHIIIVHESWECMVESH